MYKEFFVGVVLGCLSGAFIYYINEKKEKEIKNENQKIEIQMKDLDKI
jgi:hypothetical protein